MRRVTLIKSAGPMYTTRERRVVVSLLNARRAVRRPISAVMVRPACLCLLLALSWHLLPLLLLLLHS